MSKYFDDKHFENGLHLYDEEEIISYPNLIDDVQYSTQLNTLASQLSPLEKQVFASYMREIPIPTISQELGIPEAKVKNALDRCKKKIKLILS